MHGDKVLFFILYHYLLFLGVNYMLPLIYSDYFVALPKVNYADMLNFNVNNIRESIFTSILLFLFLVSAGGLIIYIFDRDLFISLDIIKLIILSSSIVMPVIFLNLFAYAFSSDIQEVLNEGIEIKLGMSCAYSVFPIYIPIAVSFFFSLNRTTFVIIFAIIEVILFLISIFSPRSKNKS